MQQIALIKKTPKKKLSENRHRTGVVTGVVLVSIKYKAVAPQTSAQRVEVQTAGGAVMGRGVCLMYYIDVFNICDVSWTDRSGQGDQCPHRASESKRSCF